VSPSLWMSLSHSLLAAYSTTLLMFAIVAGASLAPRRYNRVVVAIGCAMLAGAAAGWLVIFAGPRDLWLRYPALVIFLHPYVLALDATLAVPFGIGLILRGALTASGS
jgi:hypothetical protein